MLEDEHPTESTNESAESGAASSPAARPSRRKTVRREAGPPSAAAQASAAAAEAASDQESGSSAVSTGAAPTPVKRTRKKAVAAEPVADGAEAPEKPAPRRRTSKAAATAEAAVDAANQAAEDDGKAPVGATAVLFQAPPAAPAPRRRTKVTDDPGAEDDAAAAADEAAAEDDAEETEGEDGAPRTGNRRRRGRRGRGGRGPGSGEAGDEAAEETAEDGAEKTSASADGEDNGSDDDEEGGTGAGGTRRRRRRRRGGSGGTGEDGSSDDPPNTVTHVREPRQKQSSSDDGVRGLQGSTRIEAKRQRRRDGRDTQRRRPSIITEAEFLARREAVERVMVVKQGEERTQIAVLEDGVLVEHYVTRKNQTSMVGNVFLGKVQNVLPSMEAAFVDIGRGRNAVLYAGEVNYDASALEGKAPRIEQALKSGQTVLVQVTKDPIGHKGARLTSQVSLPGRYMVYVPDGRLSGISRKLPDTERTRLKGILKRLTPDDAGVIIRTAAEGATEEALERDLNRLKAQWEVIDEKSKAGSNAPSLIYGEPDMVIRVVRDIFNEDFTSLVVQGADEWDTIDNYVRWVAPDLAERTKKWAEDEDIFASYRVDEQLAKALDRKVWLPSGGYLVIDRTEAMIVVDVNTGKFTGKGGNLEETVTKNNIEAAEEIVRQLRLRDLGGIIVIDFIDMVLESNRDLVLRRLLECLGRDRTRHQVAEVTSLGLVQMTRKRVGEGLLESFSETCKECGGSGVILTDDPVADRRPKKPKRDNQRDDRKHDHAKNDKGGKSSDKAGGGKKSEAKPEDKKADEPKAEESKIDESKAEETAAAGSPEPPAESATEAEPEPAAAS
jgi:ribonuclease E